MLLPRGSAFAASGFVQGGFMLGDLLLLVGTPRGRGGVGRGNLVLDGTVGACAGDQLAGADVFTRAASEVIRLTDVDDIAPIVTDAVLPGTGRGLCADACAGIVLGRTAGLVDGHMQLLSQGFCLGRHGMAIWTFRQLLQKRPISPAVGLKGMGLPQWMHLR